MIKDVGPLLKECEEALTDLKGLGDIEAACYVQGFINSINALPEIKKPHGEWKGKPERRKMVTRICSACGDPSPVGYFCMWCGADMMTQNDRDVQNPCDTCKNVGDCEPCEKMREGEQ